MIRSRVLERLLLLGGLGVLIGLGVWVVASTGGSPTDDTAPDTDADGAELDSAGRLDGLESLQLPIVVDPAEDLTDGATVVVSGSGFSPGVTIAMVQCWLTATDGSGDDCDLGNIGVAYADEQGAFEATMRVYQMIDTANGGRDCALGSADEGCRIGVGNTADLDESGGAAIHFASADAGEPPTIHASPTSGLREGDLIELSGSGFQPGSTAHVTQCPVGGLDDASHGCVSRNPGEVVDIGPAGDFSMTVVATRQTQSHDGAHDCALDVHGCMLVVRAIEPPPPVFPAEPVDPVEIEDWVWVPARSPNPIPLGFDPSDVPVLPPEYTVSPSQDLVNGSVVRLEVFDMPVDGSFAVRQCADGGPRGLFCDPRGVIDVVDGSGAVDVIAVDTLVNGDDSIDCALPARRCYLTLDGELAEFVRGPIRFVP